MITACCCAKAHMHKDTHKRCWFCLTHLSGGWRAVVSLGPVAPGCLLYHAAIASSELMPPTCGCSGPGTHCPLNKLPSPTHTFMQLKWNVPDPWLYFSLSLSSHPSLFADPMSCGPTREKGNAAHLNEAVVVKQQQETWNGAECCQDFFPQGHWFFNWTTYWEKTWPSTHTLRKEYIFKSMAHN